MKLKLSLPPYSKDSIEYKSIMNKTSCSIKKYSEIHLRNGERERKKEDFDEEELTLSLDDYSIHNFDHVILDKNWVLYDSNFQPIPEALNSYIDADGFVGYCGQTDFDSIKELSAERPPILFFDHFFFNYGHFIVEAFPRLYLVLDLIKKGHKILLPSKDKLEAYGYIKPCLDSLGITDSNIIEMPPEGARFSKLIMPSHVKLRPDVVVPAIMSLKEYYYDPDFDLSYPYLYISRADSGLRDIFNKKEAETLLCKYFKFKKIIMQDLSFKEKINIMMRADVLVAVEGSSITNCIFMREDARVLSFRPFVFPSLQLFLSSLFKLETYYQICDFSCAEATWYSGKLVVDMKKLIENINKMMGCDKLFRISFSERFFIRYFLFSTIIKEYFYFKIIRKIKNFILRRKILRYFSFFILNVLTKISLSRKYH
jgi:hypothetical protein